MFSPLSSLPTLRPRYFDGDEESLSIDTGEVSQFMAAGMCTLHGSNFTYHGTNVANTSSFVLVSTCDLNSLGQRVQLHTVVIRTYLSGYLAQTLIAPAASLYPLEKKLQHPKARGCGVLPTLQSTAA
ncbi:hypothetical protein CVT25_007160 [Psilocybe cyanescens]|uniref:Uncharacterized protein n=1 Tax=Psilocybe cyanescens TaxID=93625 RepID=A0A409WVJ2_PSICY|nr:hypothetical protein CVT25_007160 [Psilocybe cyanescens]